MLNAQAQLGDLIMINYWLQVKKVAAHCTSTNKAWNWFCNMAFSDELLFPCFPICWGFTWWQRPQKPYMFLEKCRNSQLWCIIDGIWTWLVHGMISNLRTSNIWARPLLPANVGEVFTFGSLCPPFTPSLLCSCWHFQYIHRIFFHIFLFSQLRASDLILKYRSGKLAWMKKPVETLTDRLLERLTSFHEPLTGQARQAGRNGSPAWGRVKKIPFSRAD